MYNNRALFLLAALVLAACGDGVSTCDTPGGCGAARDTVIPVAQISSHQDPGWVRTERATLTGTLSDDVGVARATWTVNGGAEQALAITPGATAAFSVEVPVVDTAWTTVAVHAYDAAGNRGSTAPLRMARDTTPPTLTVTSPEPGRTYVYDLIGFPMNLLAGGTADGAVRASYSLNGQPESPLEYGMSLCQYRCFSGALLGVRAGENVVVIHAYDALGNRASREVRFVWQVKPRVEATAPAATIDATAPVTGTATHTPGVERVTYTVNGGAEQPATGAWGTPSVSFAATVPLRPGVNDVVFYAYGADGMRGADSLQVARSLSADVPGAFSQVSAGSGHSCGIEGGTLYCWGDLASGYSDVPRRPLPQPVSGSFRQVIASNFFTCALAQGGAAYCWGIGDDGRLGDGTGAHRSSPAAVSGGLAFASLGAGDYHACGVTAQGAGYCWGEGREGALGTGTVASQLAPAAVAGGHTWSRIEGGILHSCGLTTDGKAYCWGDNGAGQLGDGTYTDAVAPVAVAGGHTFTALSVGGSSICALDASGAAFCWGGMRTGGITSGLREVPGGHVFQSLSVGGDTFACALTAAGAAYCWGRNGDGQLGNGTTSRELSYTPTAVAGGLRFSSVLAGSQHACGVTTNGAAYCWGSGDEGQLGNGTTVDSSVPARVADPD
ncbi:MAG TPA: hypothetical protein VGC13_08300 [Longimicrobium sp.]|jgi:alpha-tubulin suppressor-like RCC1 family protein|uniref:RCC1 domain-containing protein n=1 Tax=Longimicrobium sp. TaxID=2029185 RepID=UPI002EDAFB51